MRLTVLALVLSGCSFDVRGVPLDLTVQDEAAPSDDLTTFADLTTEDLSTVDDLLSTPDLASPFCPATPTQVACYRFDDAFHPTLVQDDSMYGNDATATGASFPAGHSGAALTLAVGGSAIVADRPSLDIPGPITLELWAKANSLVPAMGRYGLVDDDGQYSMFLQPGGRAICSVANVSATTPSNAVTVGSWHHIACTYDRVTLRLYVDGIQRATAASTQAISTAGTNGLALASNSPSGDLLDGAIDDLRIWTVARTAQEICADAGTC